MGVISLLKVIVEKVKIIGRLKRHGHMGLWGWREWILYMPTKMIVAMKYTCDEMQYITLVRDRGWKLVILLLVLKNCCNCRNTFLMR